MTIINEYPPHMTYYGPSPVDEGDIEPGTHLANQPRPATPEQMAALRRWLANQPPRPQGRQYRVQKPDVVTNLLRTQRRKEVARRKQIE